MEAVPRLHMLWFALKSSPEGTSFAQLKKYIAEFYQEDPESYSKEVYTLETLRNQAMHPNKDGCSIMKRYYCQLHSLQNRFPQLAERCLFTFTWKDLYANNVQEITDIRYELAAVLFNIAASHTQVGASVTRGDVDGMKLACTHFQCAAWAFGELRERYANVNAGGDFMIPELLVFMQQVCFAQAQECILEKSLIDNRKPNIVAKVTAQIVVYYGAALAALLTGGDDGPVAQVIDSSVYKLWKKYVRFKISYLNCILYLYQGQHAEEQRKMGERVTLYQAAWDKLEDARKESKGLPDQKEINESLIFTADVVEAKRKNAKNENEFIYHEAIPELSSIAAVQGANLVNGIAFSVTDPEVAGEDIFTRLVPMKAHEASSMYSEEKAKLLRKYGQRVEDKDAELASFMSSLTLEHLNINEEKANKIPQGIVDRCAALNANKTAIPDLIAAMSQLAEICADVEINLKEITELLSVEEREEMEFQKTTGVKRSTNAHITELTREYQKYAEAHARAGESNETLRKAMELHVNNLKILAKPLQEIQQSVPKLSTELNTAEIFKDVKLILNKINEMKAQRAQFHADLRIAVNDDDITAKVIAHGSEDGLQLLFEREIAKHERITQLIDQNLLAQQNILQALTENYAKAAPVLKTLADVKSKRENFFSSLAASYDVYEDLLAKSAKGLEFYKKLSGNVNKLLSRLRSARDVQSEERQQRLKSVITQAPPAAKPNVAGGYNPAASVTASIPSSTPKLRDYLKNKQANVAGNSSATTALGDLTAMHSALHQQQQQPTQPAQQQPHPYLPSVRPNPLGSENPSQAACSSQAYYPVAPTSSAPNEPPPPYSLQQQQYYDPTMSGYTNPMYQQQQQNIAPPAYKQQASPNSTFTTNLNMQMGQLSIQQQQQQQQMYMQQPQLPQQQQQGPYNYQQPATSGYPLQMAQQSSYGTAAQYAVNPATSNPYQVNTQQQNYAQTGGYDPKTVANQGLLTTAMPNAATSVAPNNPYNQQQQQQNTNMNPMPIPKTYNSANPQLQQMNVGGPMATATLPTSKPLYVVTGQSATAPTATTNELQPNSQNTPLAYGQQQQQQQPPYVNGVNMQQQPQPAPLSGGAVPQQLQQYPQQQFGTQPAVAAYGQSAIKHPGYSYNAQTGQYEYGSGYQQTSNFSANYSGQYTSATQQSTVVRGTDSEIANKITVATGFDSPIVSHTKPKGAAEFSGDPAKSSNDVLNQPRADYGYYTPPYGYQSAGVTPNDMQRMQLEQQQLQAKQKSIYMQSGSVSTANTQTTLSGTQYASSSQQTPTHTPPVPATAPAAVPAPVPQKEPAPAPAPTAVPAPSAVRKHSGIDLLTDLDDAVTAGPAPILPAPILKPQVVKTNTPTPPASVIDVKVEPSVAVETAEPTEPIAPLNILSGLPDLNDSAAGLKSSSDNDNFSICSDLSSVDNFDWDSVSLASNDTTQKTNKHSTQTTNMNTFLLRPCEPLNDDKTLKYFHKEVERYEKLIESLNVKMLNGHTQLTAKWKELQDLLAKDKNKRTTTIAKLFPEKNRSLDCLPYDHARVKLEKNTDDYINAAYVKDLGSGCPNFIIAQTPQQNTINDFWSMIWSTKARTIACLHTANEMLDPYWPQELNRESHFDDFSVKCVEIVSLSHCIKYHLKLSMHGADPIIGLNMLQIKAWNKSTHSQMLAIAANLLESHQQICLEFNTPASPLVMNCLTGSERSELLAIAICAIVATQIQRPVLLNVVDVWYRICSQRQNSLRDTNILEQSMQIVLNHAHDVLNKRGILTSYQMKIAPQVASKEKEELKDPLNELDPLWKLK